MPDIREKLKITQDQNLKSPTFDNATFYTDLTKLWRIINVDIIN